MLLLVEQVDVREVDVDVDVVFLWWLGDFCKAAVHGEVEFPFDVHVGVEDRGVGAGKEEDESEDGCCHYAGTGTGTLIVSLSLLLSMFTVVGSIFSFFREYNLVHISTSSGVSASGI